MAPGRVVAVVILAALAAVACSATGRSAVGAHAAVSFSSAERRGVTLLPTAARKSEGTTRLFRSLAVTDLLVVEPIRFEHVMKRLVTQAGSADADRDARVLFQQWWDTQQVTASARHPGPHCDAPIITPFFHECPRAEHRQSDPGVDPFADRVDGALNADYYLTIGLFNRFDLADFDNGTHCGEYRIVFARRSDRSATTGRVLVNFEGVLANPRPDLKLEGCRDIARFWRELSAIDDAAERGRRLRTFYFEGWNGLPAVVHIDNYGVGMGRPTGRIRTNQFMEQGWLLREFRLERRCSGEDCRLFFVPQPLPENPSPGAFKGNAEFRRAFAQLVPNLARLGRNEFFMCGNVSPCALDPFRSAESRHSAKDNLVHEPANELNRYEPDADLEQAIRAALPAGSTLRPIEIVNRAQILSCAGCHELSNDAQIAEGVRWPFSAGHVHVNERDIVNDVPGGRYAISPALSQVLLPHRADVLDAFLDR